MKARTATSIVAIACARYGVEPAQVRGQVATERLRDVRRECARELRRGGASFSEIGTALGITSTQAIRDVAGTVTPAKRPFDGAGVARALVETRAANRARLAAARARVEAA